MLAVTLICMWATRQVVGDSFVNHLFPKDNFSLHRHCPLGNQRFVSTMCCCLAVNVSVWLKYGNLLPAAKDNLNRPFIFPRNSRITIHCVIWRQMGLSTFYLPLTFLLQAKGIPYWTIQLDLFCWLKINEYTEQIFIILIVIFHSFRSCWSPNAMYAQKLCPHRRITLTTWRGIICPPGGTFHVGVVNKHSHW